MPVRSVEVTNAWGELVVVRQKHITALRKLGRKLEPRAGMRLRRDVAEDLAQWGWARYAQNDKERIQRTGPGTKALLQLETIEARAVSAAARRKRMAALHL